MGLVAFECPLRGEKNLLLEHKHLDSVLKSISTWNPASILNLEMCIMKMMVPQAKLFEFLKSCISKWENRWRMSWPSPKKCPPLIGESLPLKSKIFWPNPKVQNSIPLTLVGVTLWLLSADFFWIIPSYPNTKMHLLSFTNKVIYWFRAYLFNRKFHVFDEYSTFADFWCRVPQGSFLGPILFLLYINGMPLAVDCDIFLYKDDICVCCMTIKI